MLITKQEILDIAYISSTITVDNILDAAIQTAEWSFARTAMSNTLYEHVSAYPSNTNYTILLSEFVKPFIAYSTKSLMFWQQIYEGALTASSADQAIYTEIYGIAKQKYTALKQYCAAQGFTYYTAPAAVLIAGFLVKRSPTILPSPSPITPPTETFPQSRVFKIGDTIYLQHYINGQWTNSGTSWPV